MHVVVTLPISEYYGTDHRKNEVNIAKKKANVMTPVAHEQKKPITISEVVVYPEGLPASESAITSPLRNLNVGDTTLDLCLFSGKAQRIERAKSIELGMFDAFEEVQNTQTKKLSPLAIRKALETGTAMGGRVEVVREEVTRPLMRKAATEIVQFIGDEFISHHFGIGGGAELLANQLKDHDIDVTKFEGSVEVLAVSIAEIEKLKGNDNGKA
ncbi:plasmid segregation protein ParM domain-containing protein [Vibrio lentus]|uniref:plasmid segregation protein ParM domain-containing protein n=1 Tax=Vibrio lentus TaxID=136468 RepID=UPI0012FFF76A|nr:plasmid segregation protein ParM domain-containing protein [Vibrio lentus]MCC4783011.1 plasmid segregation protein ParM [Vibrio lentus]MCC4857512.1 plasmid segregation protein ParM [Vibrio lentus]